VLIDDDLDLPRHLPARSKSWAIRSATVSRKHKR
jgi:hypothetical protein